MRQWAARGQRSGQRLARVGLILRVGLIVMVAIMVVGCGKPLSTGRVTPGAGGGFFPRTPTTDVAAPAPATAVASTVPPVDAATAVDAPSAAPAPTALPVVTALPQIAPATLTPMSNNDRWRAQQVNRTPFAPPKVYISAGTELFWYDPVYRQSVALGTIQGDFDTLASFTLRDGRPALEVLYEVNKRYGLTALSPALIERIRAAGYTEGFIDTYVLADNRVRPKG